MAEHRHSKKLGGYELVDSGNERKLERFGGYLIDRPCAQAVWSPLLNENVWAEAVAYFSRDGGNRWEGRRDLPEEWDIQVEGVTFRIAPTDFGHLGIFPEHSVVWRWLTERIAASGRAKASEVSVLNLFAYSGGASLAAAGTGAQVCHVDASKGMVQWARDNAKKSGLAEAPVRWIVDDVLKFLNREVRRERHYDLVVLDPPSFGRGAQGELFKIEEHLQPLLELCRKVLSDNPVGLWLSCHTPGYTPMVLNHVVAQTMEGFSGKVLSGEMLLPNREKVLSVPSGSYGCWEAL